MARSRYKVLQDEKKGLVLKNDQAMTEAQRIASRWNQREIARAARSPEGYAELQSRGLLTEAHRALLGSKVPLAGIKLTMGLATEIRQRYSEGKVTHRELADHYHCSPHTINEVVRNHIWVDRTYVPPKRKPNRFRPGEACLSAKLNWEKVREIRRLFPEGITQPKLATRFGVSVATISRIVRNRYWRDPQYTPPSKKDLWKRHQFHAGTKHHLVKLNIPKVKRIRRLYEKGWTLKRIAQRFGVDPSTVHAIARRRSWRHVQDGLGVISHRSETRGAKPGHAPTNAKLTDAQCDEIRAASAPRKVLAERYGVSVNHITRIRHGRGPRTTQSPQPRRST
jgi:uncharacterized protein YjcR